MVRHFVKVDSEFFTRLLMGKTVFPISDNQDNYEIGDLLCFIEANYDKTVVVYMPELDIQGSRFPFRKDPTTTGRWYSVKIISVGEQTITVAKNPESECLLYAPYSQYLTKE